MDILKVLEVFNLEEIDDGWLRKTRSFENLSESTLPPNFLRRQSTFDLKTMAEAIHAAQPLVFHESSSNLSWDHLVQNGARPKALVCFLNYIISKATQTDPDLSAGISLEGLLASHFYFLMLAIPNSNVYCVFSSDLFCKALQVINTASLISDGHTNLTSFKKTCIVKNTVGASKSLAFILARTNCVSSDECIDATILTLSSLTRSKLCFGEQSSRSSDAFTTSNAYDGLKCLCRQSHRGKSSVVNHVIQSLLPNFHLGVRRNNGLTSQEASVIHHQTQSFICELVSKVDKDALGPFIVLLKKLCTVCTDRIEYRQKTCDLILKLLQNYPDELFFEFLKFLLKFTYSETASHRLFAIELIGQVLNEVNIYKKMSKTSSDIESHPVKIPYEYLLFALFSRVNDVAGSVRSRALSIVAQCLISSNRAIQEVLKKIFVDEPEHTDDNYHTPLNCMNYHSFLKKLDNACRIDLHLLLDSRAVVEKLTERSLDCKVHARKSAIQVLSRITALDKKWISSQILSAISSHCLDSAISVRKTAIECLTNLIKIYPDVPVVSDAWVRNVCPLVEDNESKVSEKALECMEDTILKNLVPYSDMRTSDHQLPWTVINALGQFQVRKFFTKACQVWGQKSVLGNYKLVKIFTTHIGTENNIPAWSMMASMADYISIRDAQHFLEYFYVHIYRNSEADDHLSILVMDVLAVCCGSLPPDKQNVLLEQLHEQLSGFQLPVTILPKCVEIMQTLTLCIGNRATDRDGQTCNSPPWAIQVAQVSEKYVENALQSHDPVIGNEEIFVRAVVALGEASLLAPNTVKTDTFKQLGRVIDPSADHVPESSGKVKAGIVVTLGKMSLQCERLAKSMVGVLGRLLSSTNDSTIKSNVMIALSDLTIRYTALVEDLLPEMCLCLKDPVRVVRENTLVLITRLIQEDYLKMRSVLLFHLLSVITDSDETLSSMASSFFIDSALIKHKHLFENHFVECLFYFNGYLSHQHCQRITVSERERRAFSLEGDRNTKKRERIYRFMLSQMDPQQRFKVQCLIVDSICEAAVEDKLELDSHGSDVLKDSVFCLLTEESHIVPCGENVDDVPADFEDVANQALHTAKKNFISEVVRRYVIESELPIIANLHQKLYSMKSPLARDVIKFLHFQVQEYKADINDIFKNDRSLAKKITNSLYRYENEARLNQTDTEEEEEEGPLSRSVSPTEENTDGLRYNNYSDENASGRMVEESSRWRGGQESTRPSARNGTFNSSSSRHNLSDRSLGHNSSESECSRSDLSRSRPSKSVCLSSESAKRKGAKALQRSLFDMSSPSPEKQSRKSPKRPHKPERRRLLPEQPSCSSWS